MALFSATARPALAPVQVGVYLHSERDLFRVEAVNGERALIEDCRSEELLDVPLTELLGMEPVDGDAISARG